MHAFFTTRIPLYARHMAYLAVWGALFAAFSGALALFDALPELATHADEVAQSEVAASPDEDRRADDATAVAPSAAAVQAKDEADAEPAAPAAREAAPQAASRLTKGTPPRAVRTGPLPPSAPRRIVIPRIKVDSPVISPASTAIPVLDEALLRGVVHYPTSGYMDDISNVFLFGHSSSLPYVRNKNFKVFNRLKDLLEGDIIKIQTRDANYIYRVQSVSLVSAEEALVEFSTATRKLTLSTCNTFGEKSERYVVEADFLGVFPIID